MDAIKLSLRFSYQRLSKKPPLEPDEHSGEEEQQQQQVPPEDLQERRRRQSLGASRGRGWLRLRGGPFGGRGRWRRPRVRIRGLRGLLRRKARLVRASLGKVVGRLRRGRSHLGDLFSGNYIFAQVSPSPLSYLQQEKSFMAGGHGGSFPPARYYLPGAVAN